MKINEETMYKQPAGRGDLALWTNEHSMWNKGSASCPKWVYFDAKNLSYKDFGIRVTECFQYYMRRIKCK